MHNRSRNQTVESEAADTLQADVESLDTPDDVAARQQFRKSHLGTALRLAEMIRRNRVGVKAQVGARIDARQIILESLSHDVIEILPGRLARDVCARNYCLRRV